MIEKEIISYIKEKFHISYELKGNEHLLKDLGIDSMDFFRLVIQMEETYKVQFQIEDYQECRFLDNLISLIKIKIQEDIHATEFIN